MSYSNYNQQFTNTRVNTDLFEYPAMVFNAGVGGVTNGKSPLCLFLVHSRVVRIDRLMDFLELVQEDNGADQGSNLSCKHRRRENKKQGCNKNLLPRHHNQLQDDFIQEAAVSSPCC